MSVFGPGQAHTSTSSSSSTATSRGPMRRTRSVRSSASSGKAVNQSPRTSTGFGSTSKSAALAAGTVDSPVDSPRRGTSRQPASYSAPPPSPSHEAQTKPIPAPIALPNRNAADSPTKHSAGTPRIHEYRDSTSSISSDPFFRSYQTPDLLRSPFEPATRSIRSRDEYTSPRIRIRPSDDSLLSTSPTIVPPIEQITPIGPEVHSETETDVTMPEINLAVVGAAGVGKSTFIQKALSLRTVPPSLVASRKLSIDGVVHVVRLLELALDSLDLVGNRQLRWPVQVEGVNLPQIDGALVLYDVISQRSVAALPELLDAMARARLPFVLVSCKCDVPSSSRRINPKAIEQARASLDGVELIQTSSNVPETQKRCMGAILHRVLLERKSQVVPVTGRRRAVSSTQTEQSKPNRPTIKHSRTSSELSGSRMATFAPKSARPVYDLRTGLGLGLALDADAAASNGAKPKSRDGMDPSFDLTNKSANTAPAAAIPTTGTVTATATATHPRIPASASKQQYARSAAATSPTTTFHRHPPTPTSPRPKSRHGSRSASSSSNIGSRRGSTAKSPTVNSPPYLPSSSSRFEARPTRSRKTSSSEQPRKKAMQSFLNMDDDNDDASRNSDDIPLLDREDGGGRKRSSRTSGYTLDELVDRLLAQPLSKSDANFATIFLCLYRKFASPGEVLELVIQRFDAVREQDMEPNVRQITQLRHLGILLQWVSGNPGDFAHARTRRQLLRFLASLSTDRTFSIATKEMRTYLDVLVEDNDDNWGRSDTARERTATMESFYSTSSVQSTSSTLHAGSSTDDLNEYLKETTIEQEPGPKPARTSGAPSNSSSGEHSANLSNGSSQTLLNALENAEREAQTLVPHPRTPLTKTQWHQFDDLNEDDIALELTRMDWVMFTSIRPRDLVRHVTLPLHLKENCKSLENVNRMINHFNHIAYWVSNMILLRDKPKHRAKALEKFMGIAWKLRQMNNYNSLGAVIAGINSSAIHRLGQTREMVTAPAQKNFMRLEILMGTQKSHFAYRLAWENTTTGRIPFIPLHRRDLVSAEEGNKTFLDERQRRINWKKFEVMGDVIVGIQRSQNTPYPDLERNMEVQRLVLEMAFQKDDEELYERSVQLEPPGTVAGDAYKKKFPWFQR
ncbi:MAG: hypothetical protein M1825_002876 [Sarcosagium campestre]|nr:MAG: hypothetical protein M1825_002876 [Sarcosagium campestre]